MFNADAKLMEKWQPVLEATEAPEFKDNYRKSVTAAVLENTEKALAEERAQQNFQLNEDAPTNSTGGAISNWDPILISLVRRAMPNLIAYDIAGVQPMSGPTGLIFAMKSKYNDNASRTAATEALFNEAETDYSSSSFNGTTGTAQGGAHGGDSSSLPGDGAATDSNSDNLADDFGLGGGMSTADAEALGDASGNAFGEMSFKLKKQLLLLSHVHLKLSTQWNLLKTLKLSTVWMLSLSLLTSFLLRSLLRSTEKLYVLSTHVLRLVHNKVTSTLKVLSIFKTMLMVVGLLSVTKVLSFKSSVKRILSLKKLVAVRVTSSYVHLM